MQRDVSSEDSTSFPRCGILYILLTQHVLLVLIKEDETNFFILEEIYT